MYVHVRRPLIRLNARKQLRQERAQRGLSGELPVAFPGFAKRFRSNNHDSVRRQQINDLPGGSFLLLQSRMEPIGTKVRFRALIMRSSWFPTTAGNQRRKNCGVRGRWRCLYSSHSSIVVLSESYLPSIRSDLADGLIYIFLILSPVLWIFLDVCLPVNPFQTSLYQ